MMPAEELRAAASKIRETAAKTSHTGPWESDPDEWAVVTETGIIADSVEDGDGEHIALWHPGVAELVAVVLAEAGAVAEEVATLGADVEVTLREELALARAINGGAR